MPPRRRRSLRRLRVGRRRSSLLEGRRRGLQRARRDGPAWGTAEPPGVRWLACDRARLAARRAHRDAKRLLVEPALGARAPESARAQPSAPPTPPTRSTARAAERRSATPPRLRRRGPCRARRSARGVGATRIAGGDERRSVSARRAVMALRRRGTKRWPRRRRQRGLAAPGCSAAAKGRCVCRVTPTCATRNSACVEHVGAIRWSRDAIVGAHARFVVATVEWCAVSRERIVLSPGGVRAAAGS